MIESMTLAAKKQSVDDGHRARPLHSVRFVGESIPVTCIQDIVTARLRGRAMAEASHCDATQTTLVMTVISELARNIILYAGSGEILLSTISEGRANGLGITALDQGPGIKNIDLALSSGYSSSGGLGLGLSGVRGMVDEFELSSKYQIGTRVATKIWFHPARQA